MEKRLSRLLFLCIFFYQSSLFCVHAMDTGATSPCASAYDVLSSDEAQTVVVSELYEKLLVPFKDAFEALCKPFNEKPQYKIDFNKNFEYKSYSIIDVSAHTQKLASHFDTRLSYDGTNLEIYRLYIKPQDALELKTAVLDVMLNKLLLNKDIAHFLGYASISLKGENLDYLKIDDSLAKLGFLDHQRLTHESSITGIPESLVIPVKQ